MSKQEVHNEPVVERSTAGIRSLLFDEIERLRSGISSPAESGAISRLVDRIVNVSKFEVLIYKLALGAQKGKLPQLPPVALNGSASTPEQ